MSQPGDLDGALDELYGVVPSEFVATRKRLAGELRSGGDADAAKQLGEARRPTTAAWALNRLARDHADLVEELLARGAELRSAQARASSGGADRLRDAMAARRAALNTATDAAVAIAGQAATNPEAHRDAIAATLEAGSVDESAGDALRGGRLVREADGPVGFPEVAMLSVVKDPAPTRRSARATDDTAAAAKESAQTRARAALEKAEDDAHASEQRASELAVALGEAEQRVEERRAELEHAQSALRDAVAVASRARNELEVAERAKAAATKAVDKARRKLE